MNTIKAVHQLLPNFSPRDAIGNEARLMQEALREFGLQSEIFADHGDAKTVDQLLKTGVHRTLLLYHFSVGSTIPGRIAALPAGKLVRYHNITPPWFFSSEGELHAQQACSLGRRQIPMIGVIADGVIADSAYNAAEIAPFSRVIPTVIPVFRDYSALVSMQSEAAMATHLAKTGKQALMFVGRISPNKCQQDLIVLLHLAKRFITSDLQLILIGGFFSEELHRKFAALAERLGLSIGSDLVRDCDADILIPHGVSDEGMAALYRHARVFVSMSEHEGFGVPLVEAMFFDLPILAHRAAAVPDTLKEAGLLIDKSDWPNALAALRALLTNDDVRGQQITAMRERRQQLSLETAKAQFKTWLSPILAQFGH